MEKAEQVHNGTATPVDSGGVITSRGSPYFEYLLRFHIRQYHSSHVSNDVI